MFRTLKYAVAIAAILAVSNSAKAALLSVDWNQDTVADGTITGTLNGFGVTLTSTDGTLTGGTKLFGSGLDYETNLGTNDVANIGSPFVDDTAASVDWFSGQPGFVSVTFGGGVLADPILLFSFLDSNPISLDFDDSLILSILDKNPLDSIAIGVGNTIVGNGTHDGSADSGFALQLSGLFSSITFATNTAGSTAGEFGLTVAVEDIQVSAVPLPAAAPLLAGGLLVLGLVRFTRRFASQT